MIIGKRDRALFKHYKQQNRELRDTFYEYVYLMETILRKNSTDKEKIKRALEFIEEAPCWITNIDYVETFLNM